jgi:hypothetical protein
MDAHHHGNLPGLAARELAHPPVVDLAPLGTAAASPAGLKAPHQNETRELGSSGAGFNGEDKANTLDCAQTDAGRKPFAKLAAHAALAGCTLHELASGGFLLYRWGMAKELPDLRAVAALLAQIEGRS